MINLYVQTIADDVLNLSEVEFNRLNNLTEYNISIYMVTWINELSNYLEFPFKKTDGILGHTLKDNLGITTTINKNIEDPNQKIFTQAHELGHLIIHSDILNVKGKIDCEKTIFGKNIDNIEQEANWFAANLILPRRVLYSHIMEKHTIFEIKRKVFMSKEAILYRINNILKKIFWLTTKECNVIITQYSTCFHHFDVENSLLYRFFKSTIGLPHLDSKYIITSEMISGKQHNKELIHSLLNEQNNFFDSNSKDNIFDFNLNSVINMLEH